MNYYEIHEQAYKKLKEQGHDSWDQFLGQSDEFESFGFKDFLESALKQMNFSTTSPTALEIGCGTGPGSCFLANNGFIVEGVDVSETAIEVAQVQAKKRSLEIKYYPADICKDIFSKSKYDLIVDAHCMHCIATDEDRSIALSNIHQALTKDGYFCLSTMCGNEKCTFGESSHWDEDGILWTQINELSNYTQKQKIGEKFYIPHRRVHRTHAKLEQELTHAGFLIVSKNIDNSENDTHPDLYQAICKRA